MYTNYMQALVLFLLRVSQISNQIFRIEYGSNLYSKDIEYKKRMFQVVFSNYLSCVRMFLNISFLNVAFDGNLYESEGFCNQIKIIESCHLFINRKYF